MAVSEDDFARWCSDPVTRAFFRMVKWEIEDIAEELAEGPAGGERGDVAVMRWANVSGQMLAYRTVENMREEKLLVRHGQD